MKHLSPTQQKFVLHWGEMGTRWGINRTVAQIHALLYLSEKPLNAEQLAETLNVARSNVSTSLKELQGWGIVKLVHIMGDKRDHVESMKDVWEMVRVVLAERKGRELDRPLTLLSFGGLTFFYAPAMASGEPLARALCVFLATFWILRLIVAVFVFDVRPYLANWFYRLGYYLTTAVFIYRLPFTRGPNYSSSH